jgi:DNA-binding NarL/FixJ family response regulator
MVRPLEDLGRPEGDPPKSTFGLSPREIEVLRLIVDGRTNAEIASALVLSTRTVDHHVSHILDKMAASSRVDAVRMAIESGIVTPRPS